MANSGYIRILKTRPNFGGLVVALVFWWASVTPSLLPRPWYLQLFISGISIAIGYGIGNFISMVVRGIQHLLKWPDVPRRWRVRAWRCLLVLIVALGSLSLALSYQHQKQLRQLLGMPPEYSFHVINILVGATLLGIALVMIARLIRRFGQVIQRRLDKFLPELVADVLAIAIVTGLMIGVLGNMLYHRAFDYANTTFAKRDNTTKKGDHQPLSPYVSGSPQSLAAWNSLGKQGRSFVANATSVNQLQTFSGQPATEPIRIYAGSRSAGSLQDQADLVVKELERTGGFNRAVLCVATTTGTGWIDPDAPKALEYIYNGNTAMVGMQYSYLPSWISFLADRTKAAVAGQILNTTIYQRWRQLPPQHRPKLILFGESLGAYGSQASFKTAEDVTKAADGVLWVGPPNASSLWHQLTILRDQNSPEWRPVYRQGKQVRFITGSADLRLLRNDWASPHVLYLQYASDPVIWMNSQLLYHAPEWLNQPRGTDVSPQLHWYPLVSWAQMVVDLAIAGNVPAGHGHVYNGDIIDAMAAITQKPNWTANDTSRLHSYLHE